MPAMRPNTSITRRFPHLPGVPATGTSGWPSVRAVGFTRLAGRLNTTESWLQFAVWTDSHRGVLLPRAGKVYPAEGYVGEGGYSLGAARGEVTFEGVERVAGAGTYAVGHYELVPSTGLQTHHWREINGVTAPVLFTPTSMPTRVVSAFTW